MRQTLHLILLYTILTLAACNQPACVPQKASHTAHVAKHMQKRTARADTSLNKKSYAELLRWSAQMSARHREQQQLIEHHKTESRRYRLAAIVGTVVALFASGTALYLYCLQRRRSSSPAMLQTEHGPVATATTDTTQPETAQPDAVLPETVLHETAIPDTTQHDTPQHDTPQHEEAPEIADAPPSQEQQLFLKISHVVLKEKLYLDPEFGRQTIMNRFHLTKERVGMVFAQGSRYANVSDFATDCRLDHARQLLKNAPEMSIADIATASGFTVRSTFTRSFRMKYGLTPTEFRAQQA